MAMLFLARPGNGSLARIRGCKIPPTARIQMSISMFISVF